jgi:transposase InsO family protein
LDSDETTCLNFYSFNVQTISLSGPFNEYLAQVRIGHIYAARLHPQTVGKFERLNRTAKDRLGLVIYGSPGELESAVEEFKGWYNNDRYHEGIGNLRPVDVYEGHAQEVLAKRMEVQARTIKKRRQWNLCLTDGVEEGNLDTCGVN